jgi:hypothetical protein
MYIRAKEIGLASDTEMVAIAQQWALWSGKPPNTTADPNIERAAMLFTQLCDFDDDSDFTL